MSTVSLNRDEFELDTTKDGIVIVNALGDIPGGRTLDVSDVPAETTVLQAGHIIIAKTTDGVTVYKPMPTNSGSTAYGSLPAGYSYVGVLKASIRVKDARAAIVTIGQVNAAASPYPVTTAIKNALARIEFLYA